MVRIRCAVCDDYDTCLECFYNLQWGNASPSSPRSRKAKEGNGGNKGQQGEGGEQESEGNSERVHDRTHGYRVCDSINYPLFMSDWSIGEELLLIEGIQLYGLGNWGEISDHIGRLGNKTQKKVRWCGGENEGGGRGHRKATSPPPHPKHHFN